MKQLSLKLQNISRVFYDNNIKKIIKTDHCMERFFPGENILSPKGKREKRIKIRNEIAAGTGQLHAIFQRK